MKSIEPFALLNWTISGLVGILLIYGLAQSPVREPTEEEKLFDENKHLKKKNKHLLGRNRILEEKGIFLQNVLNRTQEQKQESQSTHATLNGELVRRENLIRSLERRLWEERKR